MLRSHFAAMIVPAIFVGGGAAAEPFYDAALCRPPYSIASATALYEAAEKRTKPDTSLLGAYVYTLPEDLGQDGFHSREVVFASTSVGVLIQGLQADALAERYHLVRERSTILGTASKGYARVLPADQQPQPEAGTVSIIARESAALPGKTLLACEFVSNEDRQALDAYDKAKKP